MEAPAVQAPAPQVGVGVAARIRSELGKRKLQVTERFRIWLQDPVGFVTNELLGFLWSKQKQICESVRDHRRTAVASCHDVGKTYVAAVIGAWWIACHEPGEAFVVTLAPTFHQVRGLLWRELNRIHAAGRLPGRMNQTEWWLSDELVAFGRSPADTDPTAVQGTHARYVLVIGDEACGLAGAILDAADSLIANDESRSLLIGNPDDPTTYFKKACDPGSGYNVINISAFDSPNFTTEEVPEWLRPLLVGKTWVAEKLKSWGPESPLYQSKVLGRFPDQAEDSLVPLAALEAAKRRGEERNGEMGDGFPNELGVDCARYGADKSMIYHRRGNVARKYHEEQKRDTMHLAGQVRLAIMDTGARRVKIDDIGLGGGVVDRLIEMQSEGKIPAEVEIVGVNVGESPISVHSDEHFKNLRAEINWSLRMRFVEGRVALVGECSDLIAQASQIKYKIKSDELLIEPKEDMKKRIGISPDEWDALVLCFGDPDTGATAWIQHFAQRAAQGQQQQPTAPANESRPWRSSNQQGAAPPQNSLATFYENQLKELMGIKAPGCKRCGLPIEGSRVTDGVDNWHPGCR